MGDFNSICSSGEQVGWDGSIPNAGNLGYIEFSNFIFEMDLLDIPLIGRSFTWYRPFGVAVSLLERILILGSWWELRGTTSQWALPRDMSYHFHIILRCYN